MNQSDGTIKLIEDKPIGNVQLFLEDILSRGLNCKYILDVGANLSEWSRMAKAVFPEAIFYLIEPLAEMELNLKQFCEDFSGSKYFLNGAGAVEEKHFLTTWGDELAGANCLVQENDYMKSINKQREIQMITIDSLIDKKEMEIPELVKLDTQGFELEALKGASRLFGNTEVFILETSLFEFTKGTPILSEVVLFMAERGYEIYDFPGFLRRPYDGAIGQIDVCFVKRNGYLRASNAWAFKT